MEIQPRQIIARQSPCFTLDACGLFQYRVDSPVTGTNLLLTTVLTVDAYQPNYRWHAEASLQSRPQVFIPYQHLTYQQKRLLAAEVMALLQGVGIQTTRCAEAHYYSLHGFVQLTDEELLHVAQRRLVVEDYTAPMGMVDVVEAEEAIDGYGFNPDRIVQVQH